MARETAYARKLRIEREVRERRDAVKELGRLAALDGLGPDDVPYGKPPFPHGYQLQERSDWLFGWWDGQRELRDRADEALRAVLADNLAVLAALRYAEVLATVNRDGHENLADAARQLLAAVGNPAVMLADRPQASTAAEAQA